MIFVDTGAWFAAFSPAFRLFLLGPLKAFDHLTNWQQEKKGSEDDPHPSPRARITDENSN